MYRGVKLYLESRGLSWCNYKITSITTKQKRGKKNEN